jgi:hypothetical protein
MFNLTQGVGQTGKWLVFDYNYKYNMNNYRSWVLEEGENYSRIQQEETTEFLEQMKNDENFLEKLKEESSEYNTMMFVWLEIATEKQINHIEKSHNHIEELYKK